MKEGDDSRPSRTWRMHRDNDRTQPRRTGRRYCPLFTFGFVGVGEVSAVEGSRKKGLLIKCAKHAFPYRDRQIPLYVTVPEMTSTYANTTMSHSPK